MIPKRYYGSPEAAAQGAQECVRNGTHRLLVRVADDNADLVQRQMRLEERMKVLADSAGGENEVLADAAGGEIGQAEVLRSELGRRPHRCANATESDGSST